MGCLFHLGVLTPTCSSKLDQGVCPENNVPLSPPIGPGAARPCLAVGSGRGRQAPRVSVNPNTCLIASPEYLATAKTVEPSPLPGKIKAQQLVQDSGDFAQKAQGADLFIVLLKRNIFSSRNLMAIFGRPVGDLI